MPTIKVDESTWRDLNARKHPGDTFDDVVRRLLDQTDADGDNDPQEDAKP